MQGKSTCIDLVSSTHKGRIFMLHRRPASSKAAGQLTANAPAAAIGPDKPGWNAPTWKQQQGGTAISAARPQPQQPAATGKGTAAAGAGRMDSWDLDDDALPDGSFSKTQGTVHAQTEYYSA